MHRDKAYLKFIATLPCIICGNAQTVAHHATTGGMGIKGSDYETVPLCHTHHMEWHNKLGKKGRLTRDQLEHIFSRLLSIYEATNHKRG